MALAISAYLRPWMRLSRKICRVRSGNARNAASTWRRSLPASSAACGSLPRLSAGSAIKPSLARTRVPSLRRWSMAMLPAQRNR
ncbi:hypothetical protein D9M73_288680 [compost metagenome]